MRFVPVKTTEQQSVLVLHRSRDLLVRQRDLCDSHLGEGMDGFSGDFVAGCWVGPPRRWATGRPFGVGAASPGAVIG
jgi:hypothetical protein